MEKEKTGDLLKKNRMVMNKSLGEIEKFFSKSFNFSKNYSDELQKENKDVIIE